MIQMKTITFPNATEPYELVDEELRTRLNNMSNINEYTKDIGRCVYGTEELIIGTSPLETDVLYFFINEPDRTINNIYIGVDGVAEQWKPYETVEYNVDISTSFTITCNVNCPIIKCPDCVIYSDDGNGTLGFMGVGIGSGNIEIYDGYVLLCRCKVTVTQASARSLPVGSTVFLNVDGVRTEFLVIHQGNPDATMYDASCDGTWLLMKDAYKQFRYDNVDRTYETSDVHYYINTVFLGLLDASVIDTIKQVKIPYRKVDNGNISVSSGAEGLSTKIFLLSCDEVNYGNGAVSVDGAKLSYFNEDDASNKRICYYDETAIVWSTRSGGTSNNTDSYDIGTNGNGNIGTSTSGNDVYVRPAFILPSNTLVGDEFNIYVPKPQPVGNLEVGSSVFMNVNGVRTEFLVVNQGNPEATIYDASCNGTWLLTKDLYVAQAFDISSNAYADSDIHSYLNNTFLNLFDSGIQGVIKQVKIPYTNGTGNSGSIATGSSGLSAKVFLLSYTEVGFSGAAAKAEGSVLGYFDGAADSKRVAKLDGTATYWWLRTPYSGGASNAWHLSSDGSTCYGSGVASDSVGVRPALILPSDIWVDGGFNVIV